MIGYVNYLYIYSLARDCIFTFVPIPPDEYHKGLHGGPFISSYETDTTVLVKCRQKVRPELTAPVPGRGNVQNKGV